MKGIRLAIFDLDNTLYDWYSAFLPAFYSMVDVAQNLLGCDEQTLLDELRAVHVKHRDVEHPFGLFETATVQSFVKTIGSEATWEKIDPAFHAYNKARKERLTLFPGTIETLRTLKLRDIRLVAYTDSKYFAAVGRIQRLGLGEWFENIFCREKAENETPNKRLDDFGSLAGKVIELPSHESKPNPRVLLDIIGREDVAPSDAAYIGDSISKDVFMAKRAGCFAVWAKYGAHTDPEMYRRLVRISHWTEREVAHEVEYARLAKDVAPDFVCEHSISEILTVLNGPTRG